MNSKLKAKSPMTPARLLTIALSAIFFIAAYSGQSVQAQVDVQFESQVTTIPANSMGWVQSFGDAATQSVNSGKPIMLVFSGSDWCSYCQLLEHEVLRTPEFESWSSDNVIKVMVDFPQYQSQSPEVAMQNQKLKQYYEGSLKGYPTVLMIEPTGSVIGRTGYVAGGPMAWISKADMILRQPAHHIASTDNQSH